MRRKRRRGGGGGCGGGGVGGRGVLMGLETPAWSPPGSNFSSSRSVTARRADGR